MGIKRLALRLFNQMEVLGEGKKVGAFSVNEELAKNFVNNNSVYRLHDL